MGQARLETCDFFAGKNQSTKVPRRFGRKALDIAGKKEKVMECQRREWNSSRFGSVTTEPRVPSLKMVPHIDLLRLGAVFHAIEAGEKVEREEQRASGPSPPQAHIEVPGDSTEDDQSHSRALCHTQIHAKRAADDHWCRIDHQKRQSPKDTSATLKITNPLSRLCEMRPLTRCAGRNTSYKRPIHSSTE